MGNYIPFAGRPGPAPSPLPTHAHPSHELSGNGSPEGIVPGNPGTKYVDLTNNEEWLKIAGVQTLGWSKVGVSCPCGGGGGGGVAVKQIYIGRAPAPPDNPDQPALNYPSGGGALLQWDVASQSWV